MKTRKPKQIKAYEERFKHKKLDEVMRSIGKKSKKEKERILKTLLLIKSGGKQVKCSCGSLNVLDEEEYKKYISHNLNCGSCKNALNVIN